MNILNSLQELVAALINQLGLLVQVPGFILGALLILLARFLFQRAQSLKDSGKASLGMAIVTGATITIGLPILLTSIKVGTTDSLLWGLITLAVVGFWLAAEHGKLITVVGVIIGILAIGAVLSISQTEPPGSVVADGVKTMTNQVAVLWTNLISR